MLSLEKAIYILGSKPKYTLKDVERLMIESAFTKDTTLTKEQATNLVKTIADMGKAQLSKAIQK